MIYMTFNQWSDGNFLEIGEPRREAYSQAELDLVEMGWNYGYDAGVQWQKSQQALDKKAENAKELGLDYEPEPVAWIDLLKEAQKIVESKPLWKRFIDGTPLANDIACWMADFAQQHTSPPKSQWHGLTDEEKESFWRADQMTSKEWDELFNAIEAKLKEKNT